MLGHQRFQLDITDGGVASLGILRVNPVLDVRQPRVALVYFLIAFEVEICVDPNGQAGQSRMAVDNDNGRTVEDFGGVEYVVNLLVFEQPVGVNAGARGLNALPVKGVRGGIS